MNTDILTHCTLGSLKGTLNFPQVIQTLAEIGVERYHADLVRMEKTYYGKANETCVIPFSLANRLTVEIGHQFNRDQIKRMIRAIQFNKMGYIEFLEKIVFFGVANYFVFLKGKKVLYFGRKGESHCELFPLSSSIIAPCRD